ncbi:amidohydrolase family protein [Rhizobium mongolense]|uniref:TIM-barrel fold metal-dependent hydrolase n=2 Tax=Rhizobium mongolense TaxID=57676 RepID=A0ABR6IY11_9HYPH|nr:amidohydrolase family protein [Rhizobium mongolense]MBB4232648.1 putative TIM-barrel fold metal-dependent hydrolase [Rhizobium mongolense]TVZ74821.1 amidohydrolase family protein [Rhizobium mongolense USDA 1844]
MLRRDFLTHASLSAVALATGCTPESPSTIGGNVTIIDAHCHVFNASDLPAVRFLRQVVFEDYPKQAYRMLAIPDPDVTDWTLQLFLHLLGADRAPTADEEIAYLKDGTGEEKNALSPEKARAAASEDTAQFLLMVDRRRRERLSLMSAEEQEKRQPASEDKFLNYILGDQVRQLRADTTVTLTVARSASQRAFSSLGPVSRYLNWFSLFRLYRHVLVERLISDTTQQGFNPIMLTPALVDYDMWLYETVDNSPLRRQMVVMDVIAQRMARKKAGPVVHGYMGFDPLREVAFRANKTKLSSLTTAREALEDHGFIGVKLYPPMGFRPSGNKPPYPKRTVDALGFYPDKELDGVLKDLYKLCVDLDAPILAHGYSSNGSGPNYEKRGDPAFWIPVFREFPSLRVCIAHFGRFDARSSGREDLQLPEGSWEWRLGEYIKANTQRNVVADISYLSEVLTAKPKQRAFIATSFKRWISEFDPGCDHILYGSDWIMLGKEAGYDYYIASINAFLRNDCGLSDDTCDKIFRRNALRFLPLERGSRGRNRLLSYYRKNGLDASRLPSASPRLLAEIWGR